MVVIDHGGGWQTRYLHMDRRDVAVGNVVAQGRQIGIVGNTGDSTGPHLHYHWWMKTDLDVGPANQWVSAYYLSRWGNDEAKDNTGRDLPNC